MKFRSVCCVVTLLAFSASAFAEHRVALLIDNSAHEDEELATPTPNVQAITTALEKLGFRVDLLEGLGDEDLKKSIERFADATPVCGTSLIVFSGPLGSVDNKEETPLTLLGANSKKDRGYPIDDAVLTLSSHGGSTVNLLLVNTEVAPATAFEPTADSLIAFCEVESVLEHAIETKDLLSAVNGKSLSVFSSLVQDVQIAGTGSVSISPPDVLVEGKSAGDEWVSPDGIVFCWCPAGSFEMGSPADTPGRYADEEQHKVEIERGFWISKYETTQHQWGLARGHKYQAEFKNHPIVNVNQSKDGNRALSAMNSRDAKVLGDWEYACPTEQQWEYAARAGTDARFYFGDDLNELPQHANFGDKSYFDTKDVYSISAHRTLNDGAARLTAVGQYQPNPWGLHDVYGNVAEWCEDVIARGGSWVSQAENCRSAYRIRYGDREDEPFIGFRFIIRKKK
jgi:formylglycine-generating enzyme required for sulfatase activity